MICQNQTMTLNYTLPIMPYYIQLHDLKLIYVYSNIINIWLYIWISKLYRYIIYVSMYVAIVSKLRAVVSWIPLAYSIF